MSGYHDGHLPECMLSKSAWDQALFTASEIGCTCALEERASNEIGRLREMLAIAYISLSGRHLHASDCATSCAPAMTPGECDCALSNPTPAQSPAVSVNAASDSAPAHHGSPSTAIEAGAGQPGAGE